MVQGWRQLLKADPIPWLLEEDNPSVRYFTLRDLLDRRDDDAEVIGARKAIMTSRPVSDILGAQYPQGYWVGPGRGYSPKYRSSVWQLMFLADLGASSDERIDKACRFVLKNSLLPEQNLFSATKAGTGTIACLNGNLLHGFIRLGYGDDATVQKAAQALAERITKEGFDCLANASDRHRQETWLPCAWGAVKALRAFAVIPPEERSPAMNQAIAKGAELLFSRDLTVADYPSRSGKISRLWFKFGFPLAYATDVLETVDVLAQLSYGQDERLQGAIELVLAKRDGEGRWLLDHTLDKAWTRFGRKGTPSKWVTLRALRMLNRLA